MGSGMALEFPELISRYPSAAKTSENAGDKVTAVTSLKRDFRESEGSG